MSNKKEPAKKRAPMKPLPVRRSSAERETIKKLAKRAGISEARLMVMATLMLEEFQTKEELRAAVQIGGQLYQTRALSVMQVRRIGHQLERLHEEADKGGGAESRQKLDEALTEVAGVLRRLGVTWQSSRRSQK
jgi:hypothetical protein